MVECSLCSFVSFFFGSLYQIITCALEYRIVIFVLSLGIAFILLTNIHTANLICQFGCFGNRRASAPSINAGGGVCGGDAAGGGGNGNGSGIFDYGLDRGPHTWQTAESNQSPINILEADVQRLPIRELLTWNHYDDLPAGVMLENTGTTVVMRACFNGNTPTISGADLFACYTFVELCFRWSLWNTEGSEHMVNFRKFPLELQAMHRTGPQGDCTSSYDLLMVAYFFEISACNPYLDPIIANLHRIQQPGSKVEIPPFPLAYLCHQFRSNFYSYGGSLTEPPCYQGAEWFVFPEPLAISERQLNEFRQLLSSDGKKRIIRNSRPVQNLNGSRVVSFNNYNPVEAVQLIPPECLVEPQCDDEDSVE